MRWMARMKRMLWRSAGVLMIALVLSPLARPEGRHVERRVAPVYPELARRMRISGVVHIAVNVAADGSVKNAKATDGNPMLTPAAEEAVRKWKFVPADAPSTESVEVVFEASN